MSELCCYCNDSTDGEKVDKILCYGPCKKHVHSKCVGLTKSTIKQLSECDSLQFYCTDCKKYSIKGVADSLNTFSSTVGVLAEALKPLQNLNFGDLFGKLTNVVQQNIATGTSISSSSILSNSIIDPKKRRREIDDNVPLIHPSKKSFSETVKSGINNSTELSAVVQRKSIVVSQLSTSTTPEQINLFIGNSLKVDISSEPNLVRTTIIMPANKELKDLNFVSFRVSMPDTLYLSLFSEEFWPRGVKIRDYVFKQRSSDSNVVFLPPMVNHTNTN